MGNEYRPNKDILASELFDGRLEKFGVHEVREDGSEGYRCLTDGQKRLGVEINKAGYVSGFTMAWSGSWAPSEKVYLRYRTRSKRRFSSTENPNTIAARARRRRQRGGPNKKI